MKERTLKTRLLTVLLTLCMVLSIVPITAFADSGAYAVKFYPGDYGTMTKNDQNWQTRNSIMISGQWPKDCHCPFSKKLDVNICWKWTFLAFAKSSHANWLKIERLKIKVGDGKYVSWKENSRTDGNLRHSFKSAQQVKNLLGALSLCLRQKSAVFSGKSNGSAKYSGKEVIPMYSAVLSEDIQYGSLP